MKLKDLSYSYPEHLVAKFPEYPPRVMWVQNGKPREVSFFNLLERIRPEDVVVINETKVLKRRLFASSDQDEEIEMLFLESTDLRTWQVLFPAKSFRVGDQLTLPEGVTLTLKEKGRPQWVESSIELPESYFQKYAEVPLPPYIQKARHKRHTQPEDESWYQTWWAKNPGSFAAPTASLHFREADFEILRKKGVHLAPLTLHVGLGTFLPVQAEDLDQHQMHAEFVSIPRLTWLQIQEAKRHGRTVWALGTTVARSLESVPLGLLKETPEGFQGETRLLIQPGFQWQVCDRIMTNFHQPESTLLALVAAFAGLETMHQCYRWALENEFRLFSYGDLSVWA